MKTIEQTSFIEGLRELVTAAKSGLRGALRDAMVDDLVRMAQAAGPEISTEASAVAELLIALEEIRGAKTLARRIRRAVDQVLAAQRQSRLDAMLDDIIAEHPLEERLSTLPATSFDISDLVVPSGYEVTDGAVVRLEIKDGDIVRVPVTLNPIFPVGAIENRVTGALSLVMAWRSFTGHWTTDRRYSRGDLMDKSRIVRLSSDGAPVSSESAAAAVRWLEAFEVANRGKIPVRAAYSRLGWIREAGRLDFLMPDGALGGSQVELDLPPGVQAMLGGEAWATGGSLDAWLRTMEIVKDYPRVYLAVLAAVASPLLSLIGAPSAVLDYGDLTGTGKTTTAIVGMSVWGRAVESAGGEEGHSSGSCLYNWAGTQFGREQKAGILHHLPLCQDDTKRAREPRARTVSNAIFQHYSGQGDARGASADDMRITHTWSSWMISTGESPAADMGQSGGSRQRTLTVKGSPWGDGRDLRETVDLVKQSCQTNYGHFGRLVLRAIIRYPAWIDRLKAHYDRQRTAIAQSMESRLGSDATAIGRMSAHIASLSAAAEIAYACGLPRPAAEQDPVVEAIRCADIMAVSIDRPREAMSKLSGWIAANAESFWGQHQISSEGRARTPYSTGWLGAWSPDTDWEWVAVLPNHLWSALVSLGFDDPMEIIPQWRYRGWLIEDVTFTAIGKVGNAVSRHKPDQIATFIGPSAAMPGCFRIKRSALSLG